MANQLTPNAKQRFFDANGAPLTGGKLYTYVAGTVTPATTYVSLNGAANANPIILDANGECNLWLTDGNSYKFELKNSLDVTQWTVDNIETSSSKADTVVTKTTTYTATSSDDVILVETATAWTLSLFTAVGNSGKLLRIVKTSTDQNELTIDASGAETINGFLTMKLKYKFDEVTIISNGVGWNIHAQMKSPTIQRFTTGSLASYTAPNAVKYLKVKMVGGGGGGGGGGIGGVAGSIGGYSEFYFDVALLLASGGGGGASNGGAGGVGFSNTISSGAAAVVNSIGGTGAPGQTGVAGGYLRGGIGGGSFFGSSAFSGPANSGFGGGGGDITGSGNTGAGGGGGGYIEAIIYNPQSTAYTYTIGGGGTGGVGGTSGGSGINGSSGVIAIEEHYQ